MNDKKKTEAAILKDKLGYAQQRLSELEQDKRELREDLDGQLAINRQLRADLEEAQANAREQRAINQELVRQRQCQDVTHGRTMDILEHVALAAGALARKAMK